MADVKVEAKLSEDDSDSLRAWFSARVSFCDQCKQQHAEALAASLPPPCPRPLLLCRTRLARCGHFVCSTCARSLAACAVCSASCTADDLLSASSSSITRSAVKGEGDSQSHAQLGFIQRTVQRRALAPDVSRDEAYALLSYAEELARHVDEGRDVSNMPPISKARVLVDAAPAFEDSLKALRRQAHHELQRVQARKRAREDLSDARTHARQDAVHVHNALRADDLQAAETAAHVSAHAEAALARPISLPRKAADAEPAPAQVTQRVLQWQPSTWTASAAVPKLPQPLPREKEEPPPSRGSEAEAALLERRRGAGGFDAALAATRARFEALDGLGLSLA